MAFRIFIALIVIACAYFAFETVRFKVLQHSLLNAEAEYTLGNPDGDVTIVKFLDYACSYCRTAHPIVTQAVEQDGNVRFLPRPISVLGAEGLNSALLPYAAAKQGKFEEMHDAVMENYRVINDDVMRDLALQVGIDPEQFKADFESDSVQEMVEKNLTLFKRYRMNSTPTYAIGSNIMFSPDSDIGVSDFLNLFDEARGQ